MRWLITIGAASGLLGPGLTGLAAAEPVRAVKPVLVWSGTGSAASKEAVARCRSDADWAAAWLRHTGRGGADDPLAARPEVDFGTHMVVALFHGDGWAANAGPAVAAVLEEADCLRVRYRPRWMSFVFPPDPETAAVLKKATRGYAFILLPASGKRIVFEEDVQTEKGKPAVWKGRHEIPATSD
jgi:hypothetical protein